MKRASDITRPLDRAGFSVVELLVYLGIFALILAGVAALVRMEGTVERNLRRLDTLYDLRQASWNLSRALVTGTSLLHPAVNLQTSANQILFTDQNWMKCLVFVDDQRRLKIARMKPPTFDQPWVETLAENVVEFKTKRLTETLINYSIKAAEPGARPPFNKTFLLSNSLQMTNRSLSTLQGKP